MDLDKEVKEVRLLKKIFSAMLLVTLFAFDSFAEWDPYGYNYERHRFDGKACDAYWHRGLSWFLQMMWPMNCQDSSYDDTLEMRWNEVWLSSDGVQDR